MPKDKNGRELRVGDTVVIHATVLSLRAADDAANCTIETQETALHAPAPHRITLFSGQVAKEDRPTGEPKTRATKRAPAPEDEDQ